jgi:hypothetical protein
MDIDVLVQNFRESQKEREEEEEEEEEEENDVLEEEKCRVKTFQDTVKSQSINQSIFIFKFKGTAGICRTAE